MLVQRWERVDQLFKRTLELPGAERSVYLDRECASDSELRLEVERLLEQYVLAEKSDFLENPPIAPEPVEPLPRLTPGQMISRYCVHSELGRGGMGIVYKAWDSGLHRLVALKVLCQDRALDHEHNCRFLEEAQSVAALNHPNIVSIYGMGEQDGVCFIAMEYVAGKTLRELLPRHGMQPDQVLELAAQIVDALAAMHEAGIIHCDLKPENIMVSDAGIVKVLDFGLAKSAASDRPRSPDESPVSTQGTVESLTALNGATLGTLDYMSPEQANGRALDPRSDIFSFGALLREMLTGSPRFEEACVQPGISPELMRIASRCLRELPEQRFQSVSEIRVALKELMAHRSHQRANTIASAPTARRTAQNLAGRKTLG